MEVKELIEELKTTNAIDLTVYDGKTAQQLLIEALESAAEVMKIYRLEEDYCKDKKRPARDWLKENGYE